MTDPADPTKVVLQKGKQLPGFAALRDDGTTACGCWIYCRLLHRGRQPDGPARQRRSRRAPARTSNWACVVAGQPPHPLQPRLGRPRRQAVGSQAQADRVERQEVGRATTCPTSRRRAKPDVVQPFIMNPEGVARLFARGMMSEGPFPEHYEPFESAARQRARAEDPRQPGGARVQGRPGGVRQRRRSSRTRRRPTG